MAKLPWQVGDRRLVWGQRTYLMAVLNVTPDSFSDGGRFDSVERALAKVEAIATATDILDIGGESTRPGSTPVTATEELARVIPVIRAVRARHPHLPISIDTTKAVVAEAALAAGANILNDVSAGRDDPKMLPLAAQTQVPMVLMHRQGLPPTMQQDPQYRDVVTEVRQFLTDAQTMAAALGIAQVAIDPGIGFGKTLEHNLALLRHLSALQTLNAPVLVGVSRKSFLGNLCDRPHPADRVWGTAAACTAAIAGGADILRVHDVWEMRDVCRVADALYRP
ncbi:MAG: dihydropteroate synthase [Oscillatoriales cyanobacterium SM2_1_8]|nr:dihydropteroate synthase [Oscillatoriales cyanobacterium SM2_1_8]